MSKMNITPYITSEDISRLPDQASFKLNTLIDNLTAEMIDREKGDNEGSEALQAERDARINGDDGLSAAIQDEEAARINADNDINARIDEIEGDALKLVMSTIDIGEGYPLADNTLYGVYE